MAIKEDVERAHHVWNYIHMKCNLDVMIAKMHGRVQRTGGLTLRVEEYFESRLVSLRYIEK